MFERFTAQARRVVVGAQDESRRFGHGYIGSEHLLLGLLLVPEGMAAFVLQRHGLATEEVRAEVVEIVGQGEVVVGTGQIPFTPGAKTSLELSLQEALVLGHKHIGTEHILLGLIRANEGVAARILLDYGLALENVRREVVRIASSTGLVEVVPPLEDVELTSPPLAPELMDELERLAAEKNALIDTRQFEDAARLAAHEHRLRAPAEALVREWRTHRGGEKSVSD